MKTWRIWVTVAIAAMLTLMGGGAGAVQDQVQPEAIVAEKINYQGWLTDLGGTPLNGTYPMRFEIYDAEIGGTFLWDSGPIDLDVDHGRFSVDLSIEPLNFDGQELWVRIYVDGEWLTPRQEILAVPYALSLRPGARIVGDLPHGWGVEVFQLSGLATGGAVRATSATGTAVHGHSDGGYGLAGYSYDSYAVYGLNFGTEQAHGYGGYFHSDKGIGVYGFSNATSDVANQYTPGVYGRSTNGTGVYGVSDGGSAGVRGESDGTGVYGLSTSGTGVYGYTDGNELDDYGVYGRAGGMAYGVYGYQSNTVTGLGVYGENEGGGSGVSGVCHTNGNGTWGYSGNYRGVAGMTGRGDNNYGLYTEDNLYSLNYHTVGAVMQVVQNGGDEPLEQGDVVVIAGVGESPADGLPPVLQVRKASEANSTAVVGVVAASYAAEWMMESARIDPTGATGPEEAIPQAGPGPIARGEYLLVVVQGPCQAKAEAFTGSIQPGDLLSSGGQAGYVAKAPTLNIEGVEATVPGSVLGKAMETLDAGEGLIYVYVTLQ
jgi:hypothetical protein